MELKKKVAGAGAGVLAVAGAVYVSLTQSNDFKIFNSNEGRFLVSMPSEVAKSTQSVESDFGEIELTLFSAGTEKTGFVVAYSDYPQEVFDIYEPAEMLGWVADGVAADVKGKLVSETELKAFGRAAKDYQVKIPEQGIYTSRLILNDKRLYQLITMSSADDYDARLTKEFFNSFKIR